MGGMDVMDEGGRATEVEIDPELEDYLEEVSPTQIRLGDALHMGRFVARFLRPYRPRVAAVCGLILVDTVLEMCFPIASRWLVDDGLIGKNGTVVAIVLGYLAVGATFGVALGILGDRIEAALLADLIRDIRQKLFDHLQLQSWHFFQSAETGQILSRFSGDVVAVEGMLVGFLSWAMLPALEVCYSFVLMFYFNVWLALVGSSLFAVVILVPRVFVKRAFALSIDKREFEGKLLGAVQESLATQGVIRAFGIGALVRRRFANINSGWRKTTFRLNFFASLVESTADGGLWLVHFFIFGLGAYWVFRGRLTVGTLVAFESMYISMGYALTYVTQFVPVLAEAGGSVGRLDEFLSLPACEAEIEDKPRLPRLADKIVFESVSFRYAKRRFKLADFDLTVPRGSHVVIVGPSGAGKSTLLGLLLRLYEPEHGRITFDGQDIRHATLASLRGQIGAVFQECFLFEGSIAENIAIGDPGADRQAIEAAARAADVEEFIASLPQGYETRIGERGRLLSLGQRQRIAIARALVRDPSILLLDEATSALDHETEAAINATLHKLAGRRTILAVTHRITAAAQADLIVVMERGRIREIGSHGQLVARGGFYGKYWKLQQQNSEAGMG